MVQFPDELGRHPDFPIGAMSKHEVTAFLCRLGFNSGFWSIPEYDIAGLDDTRRRIDVVWALRLPPASGRIWRPIAAFEIEGHNVELTKSVPKNANSLSAAANAGAVIRAMVLFQVGPDGRTWGTRFSERYWQRVQEKLCASLRELRSSHHVELLLDETLRKKVKKWIATATAEKQRILSDESP